METLIGANIFESRHSQGTTTNPYGFYSITIPEGQVNLKYSYIEYETLNKTIYLKKDTTINILMKDNYLTQEVIILSDKTETGIRAAQMSAIDIPINHIKKILAHEANIYIEDNFNIEKKFQLNADLHMSMFNVQHKSYFSLQPRLSARYELTEDVSIKGAYTKMNQYIHLLSSSTISMPTGCLLPKISNPCGLISIL